MADLYSEIGQNAQRVLTASDNTGPETTWLYVRNTNETWYGGESENVEPELTPSDNINFKAIVECIQQYCEVYEVIRPWYSALAIKVRLSSVPYAAGESKANRTVNSILTASVQAHPGLGANYSVYNGRFQGATVNVSI